MQEEPAMYRCNLSIPANGFHMADIQEMKNNYVKVIRKRNKGRILAYCEIIYATNRGNRRSADINQKFTIKHQSRIPD